MALSPSAADARHRHLGIDLLVVPGFTAHDAAEVDLVRRVRPARGYLAPGALEAYDVATVAGRENIAQALLLRLLTDRGALAALGHAQYGSRLIELIGRRKTEALRNLCRAFVLEVVAQEPRVEDKAVELRFHPEQETPSTFVFTVAVRPVAQPGAGLPDPLGLSLEVAL